MDRALRWLKSGWAPSRGYISHRCICGYCPYHREGKGRGETASLVQNVTHEQLLPPPPANSSPLKKGNSQMMGSVYGSGSSNSAPFNSKSTLEFSIGIHNLSSVRFLWACQSMFLWISVGYQPGKAKRRAASHIYIYLCLWLRHRYRILGRQKRADGGKTTGKNQHKWTQWWQTPKLDWGKNRRGPSISISHLIFQDVNKVTAARLGLFSFTYRLADITRHGAKDGLKYAGSVYRNNRSLIWTVILQ